MRIWIELDGADADLLGRAAQDLARAADLNLEVAGFVADSPGPVLGAALYPKIPSLRDVAVRLFGRPLLYSQSPNPLSFELGGRYLWLERVGGRYAPEHVRVYTVGHGPPLLVQPEGPTSLRIHLPTPEAPHVLPAHPPRRPAAPDVPPERPPEPGDPAPPDGGGAGPGDPGPRGGEAGPRGDGPPADADGGEAEYRSALGLPGRRRFHHPTDKGDRP